MTYRVHCMPASATGPTAGDDWQRAGARSAAFTWLHVELRFGSLDDALADDLQEWLNRFLTKINELADSIRQTYLEAL